jgi:ACS family tartrate transporter-like MFS transporter
MSAAAVSPDEGTALRKAYGRLIPFLFILYVGAYLDRINVGFAALQMKQDLGYSDTVYGLGAGIFFLGYFVFEVPSNLILARVGARIWIARIMITWALVSSATAFIHTPLHFYGVRFLLGVTEAGFFPGIIYYLSSWFPAKERASAISRFMTAVAVAGIIGGPMSGALLKMDGVAGLAGWQWLFLLEGVPSLVLGILVLRYLPDRPEDARWLSAGERAALSARIREDAAKRSGPEIGLRKALLHGTVWRLAALYFTLTTGLYSISMWLPQIVKGMSGLGNGSVALISSIPYLAAAVGMVLVARHSDRKGERRLHTAAMVAVGALGLALSALPLPPAFGVVALCIAAVGVLSAFGPFWVLPTAFLAGPAAAAGIALINSVGNLGGFVGPYLIGRVRDATGSFAGSLLTIAAMLLVGSVVAISLRRSAAAEPVDAAPAAGRRVGAANG